ncbi:MAG: hypothetical protein WC449_05695 [Candidatus Paceibacterota bacterium]
MNTWPGGKRRALTQSEHEAWNSSNYPGTRQMCCMCGEPTELCEEDGIFDDNGESYCLDCAIGQGILENE